MTQALQKGDQKMMMAKIHFTVTYNNGRSFKDVETVFENELTDVLKTRRQAYKKMNIQFLVTEIEYYKTKC